MAVASTSLPLFRSASTADSKVGGARDRGRESASFAAAAAAAVAAAAGVGGARTGTGEALLQDQRQGKLPSHAYYTVMGVACNCSRAQVKGADYAVLDSYCRFVITAAKALDVVIGGRFVHTIIIF